jgi:ABC-type polysaccharide/polyol phosphate export permease
MTTMLTYLRGVWKCRYFWLSLVRVDLRTRYRRSVLGIGWSLLQPLTMTAVFCLILRPLLMPEQPLDYCVLFFLTGLALWNYIVHVSVQGCQALFRGEAYIRQYPAPMAIYPLRTALNFGVHFLLVLALVVVLACCRLGTVPVVALLSLVPALVMLLLLGWSLAVLTSFANVYYQDTQHLCEVGFQILFYGTPILYGPELLRDRGLDVLLALNPLVPLFDLVREPLLYGRVPSALTFAWAGAVVLAALAAASATLARLQRRVIFQL